MLATALVGGVADSSLCRSARNFSAWIGLVPKQYSSTQAEGRSGSAASGRMWYGGRLWDAGKH